MIRPVRDSTDPGRKAAVSLALVGAAALLASACSGHAPELAALEYRLALRPADPRGTRMTEQLSVFAAVRDEDGVKDLAALHVLHDGEEFVWTLTPETWTRSDRNKETWVGGTGLSVPDHTALPRGLYRVVLEDLAGESDEATFFLGTGIEIGAAAPVLRRDGDSVVVSSKYGRTELLFLDASGALLRAVDAPRQPESLDRLYGSPGWRQDASDLVAYAYDGQRNLGVFSWTMKLTP